MFVRKDCRNVILSSLSSGQAKTTNQISIIVGKHWYTVFISLLELERDGKVEAIRGGQITLWKIIQEKEGVEKHSA